MAKKFWELMSADFEEGFPYVQYCLRKGSLENTDVYKQHIVYHRPLNPMHAGPSI